MSLGYTLLLFTISLPSRAVYLLASGYGVQGYPRLHLHLSLHRRSKTACISTLGGFALLLIPLFCTLEYWCSVSTSDVFGRLILGTMVYGFRIMINTYIQFNLLASFANSFRYDAAEYHGAWLCH